MEPSAGFASKRRGHQVLVSALAGSASGTSSDGGGGGGGSGTCGGAAPGGGGNGGGGGGIGGARGCLRHPVVGPILYMLLGGAIVYCGLAAHAPPGGASLLLERPQPMDEATAKELAAAARLQRSAEARAAARRAAERPVVCEDSCFKARRGARARDGVCDDGRHPHNMSTGHEAWVLCDLGTDCGDCGPWKGAKHSAAWREPVGPVEFLRRKGVEMRVRKSSLVPRFWFAYTNPQHDVDVSGHMAGGGVVELGISHIFYHILHKPCTVEGSGLLVDVGGNFGWFSVFAATLGCNVVAFEPVPQFRAFFEYNLARNNLEDRVQIRPTVAVAYPGRGNYTVVVPQRGIWGTAGIDGANIDEFIDNAGAYQRINVTGEALDNVLAGRHVDLLKADVEGYEPDVMQGASRLLSEGRVDNVVMEYSPHVFEKNRRWDDTPRTPRMLVSLLQRNFTIGNIARREGEVEVRSWSQPLGLLPGVTGDNLKYDLADTRLMTNEGMVWGREPCAAMVTLGLIVDGIPERLHPKSFRATISFNTNIWASRAPRFKPYLSGPPVGVLPADVSLRDSWFPPPDRRLDMAIGGRSCEGLRDTAKTENMPEAERAALLVPHHCRCAPELPCKAAEDAADACARSGEIPWED
ncbi:MAG: hypothetical protein J3K34DRAFT_458460 [Monoraphidium minutum]|nr:MAG: hypothetical protein J3K34DRAFT_458460 [Monoraphidium minutum]